MEYTVYIDDTGTPTFKSQSKYDSGDWHSHVGFFIEQHLVQELSNKIFTIVEKYKEFNEFDEFHFIRILSGKDGWRKVSLTTRLKIFEEFANLYQQYKFPILIQSFTSDDIIRNQMEDLTNIKMQRFDFSKLSDMTLFFLFFRIKKFVLDEKFDLPIKIKVDSGKGEHLEKASIPILKEITVNSEIEFIDSKKDRLIQFADFISYGLNRMRWIIMTNSKNSLDIELLRIFSKANFEVLNLKKVQVDAYKVQSEDYDRALRRTYDLNGNLSDDAVELKKNKRKK